MLSSTSTEPKPGKILNKINQIKDYLDDYTRVMNELDNPHNLEHDRLRLLELELDFKLASEDLVNWTRDRYDIDSGWQYIICEQSHKEYL